MCRENRLSVGCLLIFAFRSSPNIVPKICAMNGESSLRCWPQCRQFSKQGLNQNLLLIFFLLEKFFFQKKNKETNVFFLVVNYSYKRKNYLCHEFSCWQH